jgi:hypothetical protein
MLPNANVMRGIDASSTMNTTAQSTRRGSIFRAVIAFGQAFRASGGHRPLARRALRKFGEPRRKCAVADARQPM